MVLSTSDGRLKHEIPCDSESGIVVYSARGRFLVVGASNGSISIYDGLSGELVRRHESLIRSVSCLKCSADRDLLAVASYEKEAILCGLPDGEIVAKIGCGIVSSISFDSTGTRGLLGQREDRNILVWKYSSNEIEPILDGHSYTVNCISYSGNGQHVATGSSDRTVRLWETDRWNCVGVLQHERLINSVCFSPDSRRVLTGSMDGTARIWDVATAVELIRLQTEIRSDIDQVKSASFSSDGMTVLYQGS
jgi:WD40 repeat protein